MIEPQIKIHLGDCMEAMRAMEDNAFDLAIVDPPYGIDVGKQRIGSERKTAKWNNPNKYEYKVFEDGEIPSKEYFEQLFRISKNQIVWGGNYFTEYLPPSKGWIVWNKKADIKEHLSMAELAWTSFDKKCNVFEYLWAGFKKKKQIKRIHPTQKPIDLYKWILKHYAEKGSKIIDTHGGSMSIALACHEMGFDLDLWEIYEEYYNAGLKRFNDHKAQLRIW